MWNLIWVSVSSVKTKSDISTSLQLLNANIHLEEIVFLLRGVVAVNFIPNEFLDTSQRNNGSLLVITHLFFPKIIEIKKL